MTTLNIDELHECDHLKNNYYESRLIEQEKKTIEKLKKMKKRQKWECRKEMIAFIFIVLFILLVIVMISLPEMLSNYQAQIEIKLR